MFRNPNRNLSSDAFLVATSLFIAFVIWIIAKSGDIDTVTLTVPLRLENVPQNVEAKLSQEQVQVTISAPQNIIRQLSNNAYYKFEVDWKKQFPDPRSWCSDPWAMNKSSEFALSKVKHVAFTSILSSEARQRFEEKVKFLLIEPESIHAIGKYITRRSIVEFPTQGSVLEGYKLLGSIQPTTSRNVLLLASNEVFEALGAKDQDDIVKIKSEVIDIDNAHESFNKTVRLILPQYTELFYREDSRIEVRVSIEEIIDSRTISGVPIVFQPLNESLDVRYAPTTATLSVRGPVHILKNLTVGDFTVRPDAPQEQDGLEVTVGLKASFSPQSELSAGAVKKVTIVKMEPEAVLLKFQQRRSGHFPWTRDD